MVKEKDDNDLTIVDENSVKSISNENRDTDYSDEDTAEELKTTRDELYKYKKLYDETLNKLKYGLADFDNFRKSVEKQNILKIFSIRSDLLLNVINFREDLSRALDTVKQQQIDSSIIEGLKNILKNIDTFLHKENVREIVSINEEFDPNLHEILGFSYINGDDNQIKENIVTKELRRGYLLDERVLRPSLVEVSKKIIKNIDNNNDNSTLGDDISGKDNWN